jgi:hypothetical protein
LKSDSKVSEELTKIYGKVENVYYSQKDFVDSSDEESHITSKELKEAKVSNYKEILQREPKVGKQDFYIFDFWK